MSLTKGLQDQRQQILNLKSFFGDKEFETPAYQRSYKWKKEQIEDFFSSLSELLAINIGKQENACYDA